MVRASLLLLLIGSLLGPAVAEEDGARSILAKVVEDMGGDAALAEVRGMRTTYDGSYGGMPYRSEMIWAAPHRVMYRLDAGMFKGSMGIDAGVGWMAFMGPVARVRGSALENLLDWRSHTEVFLMRPILLRKDVTIARGPVEKDGAVTREHILLTFPGDRNYDLTIHIDHGKSTLVTVTGDMVHMDGRRGTFRWDLSEPGKFGDIVLPTKLRMRNYLGDKVHEDMTETLTSLEWNPKITKETFTMPELGLPIDEPAVKDAPAVTGLTAIHHGHPKKIGVTIRMLHGLCFDRGYMTTGPVMATLLDDGTEPERKKGVEVLMPVMIMGAPPTDLPEGVTVATRPKVRVATMNCRGEYGVADVHGLMALMKWVVAEKHEMVGPPRILYHHDAASTVPEDQISEIQIPIK